MKKILILMLILIAALAYGQQPLANRYILTTDVLTVTEADRTTYWTMQYSDVETFIQRNLNALENDITLTGGIDADGQLDFQETLAAGASNGHITKITMAAGLTYTGTMAGLTVKNYDADATVVHGSGENTGLAVFMKQMSASGAGGENSLMSLHSHSSAIGKLDHGVIVYPDTVGSVFAVRAAVIDYGLDFNDRDNVTVNNAEIRGSNGETIDNTTDGSWDFSGFVKRSVTASITAGTTQSQAGATLLTSDINEISTCGTTNDGVKLPVAVAGLEITIINNGAETAYVYPNTDDDLGAGVNTATTLAAAANVTFVSYNATNWETK
jgi:hypothetical protein